MFAEADQVASSTSPRESEHHSRFLPCRHLRDRTDWVLNANIFRAINLTWGPLQVDLFATWLSAQLRSWRADPEAEATDAFSQNYSTIQGFAHPPWCLIAKVLMKVQREEAMVILVAPLWRTQPWFPSLLSMLADLPILLPDIPDLIIPSPNCDCPVLKTQPQLRMEGLRHHFRSKEIPNNAIELLMSSWRSKTISNYNSAWKKWEGWCKQRGMHPFAADVSSILGFLADQFEEGRQYCSLNCYRSALSSTHLPVEGFPVGQHPLVVKLLKGAYIQRPPKPRYSQTWDVTQMPAYLRSLGGNETLSLKLLTQKLAMLLALVLGHRSSDLVRLTLCGRSYIPEGVTLLCKGIVKQTRPGNEKSLQPVVIASFEEEPLCPVACLRVYEEATAKFKKDEAAMQLFLAVVPPHWPISSSTIARWVKNSLERAGLESTFSAHSTRSAVSTAAALSGLSTREIMDRAGWSSLDTFCR